MIVTQGEADELLEFVQGVWALSCAYSGQELDGGFQYGYGQIVLKAAKLLAHFRAGPAQMDETQARMARDALLSVFNANQKEKDDADKRPILHDGSVQDDNQAEA